MHCNPERGFTLIEMLVVVVILGVLATVAFPLAELSKKRAAEAELRTTLREIRNALDAYKQAGDEGHIQRNANESGYPHDLQVLVDGVEDSRSPERKRMYFLRSVPFDPLVPHDATDQPKWALRSYDSPANDPKPGNDIYDIHSTSDQVGLDGIPYSKW
jgi:general secretion pathway protein G